MKLLLNATGGAMLTVCLGLTALALAADYSWLGEIAANLRWQLGALALGSLPLLAIGGARLRAALATGLAVWHMAPALMLGWAAPEAVPIGAELRVASVNLYAGNRDTERIGAWLAAENPDIIVLLEFSEFWRGGAEEIASADAYPHRVLEPRLGAFGIAVLSRLPLVEVAVEQLGDPGIPFVSATVDHAGCEVDLWAVHTFPPITPAMRSARDELLQRVGARAGRSSSSLVVGDLNVTLYSRALRDVMELGGLRDSRAGIGRAPSWMPVLGPFGLDLDHVLLGSAFGVRGRRLGPAFGSDHLPVVVDLVRSSADCLAVRPREGDGGGGVAPAAGPRNGPRDSSVDGSGEGSGGRTSDDSGERLPSPD